MSRNITDALIDVLQDIDARGQAVAARGSEQREVLGTLITIERPQERVLTIPHRNNNIFAQVAETLWVLAGRDDLRVLESLPATSHRLLRRRKHLARSLRSAAACVGLEN